MKKIIKQAFTLIELLVVIAIIGILSGLIVVVMGDMKTKATIAKAQVFSNSLRNSMMMNIVGEWELDEGYGSAANDTWSKINNGTLYGFADISAKVGDTATSGWMSSSNCVSGICLKFDGANNYIDCGNGSNLNITSNITSSAWIKVNSSSTHVMGKDSLDNTTGWTLFTNGFGIKKSNANYWIGQTTTNVSDGNWHLLTATYIGDGSVPKFYIDGAIQIITPSFIGSALNGFTDSGQSLTIGRSHGFAGALHFFNGLIDDVRVYNVAIPTSRIKEQYYLGLNNLLMNNSISKEEYLSRINNYASNN